MKMGQIVLANFDARISKIEIKPKNKSTKVIILSKIYNDQTKKKETVRIVFVDVAAIDFRINYFDNSIGAEGFGLYQITDGKFIEKLVKEIFERRKEIYLLEGDYCGKGYSNSSCRVYPAPFAVKLKEDRKTIVEPDISVICDRNTFQIAV